MRAKKRSVVMVKGESDSIYEEAYFILKNELSETHENVTRDMVSEANKIIESSFEFEKKKKNKNFTGYVFFLLLGALIIQILNIIF